MRAEPRRPQDTRGFDVAVVVQNHGVDRVQGERGRAVGDVQRNVHLHGQLVEREPARHVRKRERRLVAVQRVRREQVGSSEQSTDEPAPVRDQCRDRSR